MNWPAILGTMVLIVTLCIATAIFFNRFQFPW